MLCGITKLQTNSKQTNTPHCKILLWFLHMSSGRRLSSLHLSGLEGGSPSKRASVAEVEVCSNNSLGIHENGIDDKKSNLEYIIQLVEANDSRLTAFDASHLNEGQFQLKFQMGHLGAFQRLCAGLERNSHLARLTLSHLGLSDGHLQILADVLTTNTAIALLDLSWNHFTDTGDPPSAQM